MFLTSTHNPYLEFIGAYIRARLKVGKRSNDNGQFNFMIDSKSDSMLQLSNDIVSNLKMVFGDWRWLYINIMKGDILFEKSKQFL